MSRGHNIPTPLPAAKRAIIPPPKTFAALVAAVRAALITGQARADRAYLESYHTTGHLIDAHILFFEKRADYGSGVIPQLAAALGCGDRFVDALVAKATAIVINTTKPDKYDRYLADVFLEMSDQPSAVSDQLLFLNQALLENGHAVRKDAADFSDWEKDAK